MSPEEQQLAELLKRAVPEPPRQLTYEEITVPHANWSRKSWLMPTLAAAAVVVIGVTVGAVAAHSSGGSQTPVASLGTSRSSVPAPTPSVTAVPTPSVTAVPTKKPGPVVVPNLVGMNVNQAHFIAKADGFAVELQEKAFPNLPPGTVGAQSPSAGTTVPIYVTIVLYYAPGSVSPTESAVPSATTRPVASATAVPTSAAPVTMPNVLGREELQAVQILQSAGFRVDVVHRSAPNSQQVQNGTVWEEWPTAGASAPQGSLISIYVQTT